MQKRKLVLPIVLTTLLMASAVFVKSQNGLDKSEYTTNGLLTYLEDTSKAYSYFEETSRMRVTLSNREKDAKSTLEWFKGLTDTLEAIDINAFEVSIPINVADNRFKIAKYVITPRELKTLQYDTADDFFKSLEAYKVN